jgi:6-phosphogluconolactonase
MNPTFLRIISVLFACLALTAVAPAGSPSGARELTLYVGTYTDTEAKGIYRMRFNTATGALSTPELAAQTENPSFLVLHPNGRFLYAANEWGTGPEDKGGWLSAYSVGADGSLTYLNKQPAHGVNPCHLEIDKSGKHVLTANYSSGTTGVFPIRRDGTLGEATSVVKHEGKGPKPNQEAAHAHAIVLDRANRYGFVADLGIDAVVAYRYDAAKGTLTEHKPGTIALPPGSGPRHFLLDARERHAYVITEMGSAVTAFDYDAARGTFQERATVSLLPAGFSGETDAAELALSRDGRFLYASNRGRDPQQMDTLAIFSVDAKTGALTPVGHQTTGGRTPRHFAIDPTGRFLLAAHQRSNSIAVFRIDAATGKLTPVGEPVSVGKPVCLLFARKP